MLQKIKQDLVQWLWPELLEDFRLLIKELEEKENRLNRIETVKNTEISLLKVKHQEEVEKYNKVIKNLEQSRDQFIHQYKDQIKKLVDEKYESLRKRMDDVVFHRYHATIHSLWNIFLQLIRYPKSYRDMTEKVYGILGLGNVYIQHHDKPMVIENSKNWTYATDGINAISYKITIPATTFYMAFREEELDKIREIYEQETTSKANSNS